MVSVASRVGALQHKHEIESDALERELAQEEVSLRNKLDRDHANAKQSARDQASTLPPSGGRAPIRMPKDADHERNSEVELAKLRAKHDERRQALRHKQMMEKTAALNAAQTSEKHKPQTEPLPHQPTFEIWKDLDDARRRAILGVFENTAKLRDDADADILNLAKTKSADRYMKPGTRMADDAFDRGVRAHYDISKKEDRELAMQHAAAEGEIESKRRRIHQHAVERGQLAKRQYEENRGL
jgi:hypothetical protein